MMETIKEATMRKLNIEHPARLFDQLRAITNACDPNEYAPLEYDMQGEEIELPDGSPATGDWLLAIKVVELADALVQHAEGNGAMRRSFRLVYLAPLETYFWGEYRWRDDVGFTIRVRWHRIPKDYNPQLDQIRQRNTGRGCSDA
jgi:hypothetical protein